MDDEERNTLANEIIEKIDEASLASGEDKLEHVQTLEVVFDRVRDSLALARNEADDLGEDLDDE